MKNIENLIVEFVRQVDTMFYMIVISALLCFPVLAILIKIRGYKKTKKEKRVERYWLIFLLFVYIIGNAIFLKTCFTIKNKTIVDLNNENNVVFQEKNNNIELYYIPKENNSKIDENVLKKANLKITIQQTTDEKYYIYFNDESEQNKEVKKEDLKEFINNIKSQENYKEIEKNKKLTLEDFK